MTAKMVVLIKLSLRSLMTGQVSISIGPKLPLPPLSTTTLKMKRDTEIQQFRRVKECFGTTWMILLYNGVHDEQQ